MTRVETNGDQVLWFLEGLSESDGTLRRIPILAFPFRVGRRDGNGLTLSSSYVDRLALESAPFAWLLEEAATGSAL